MLETMTTLRQWVLAAILIIGGMKWKALRLRDDGTTYTANYDLVKVK